MKKSILIALAAFAAGSIFAQESDTVSSANIVGYVKKDLVPGQYILAGVNFNISGGMPTLKDVVGTNQLRRSENYFNADRVGVWNKETSSYQYYATYIDGEFYPCNTAEEWNNATSSTNPVVPIGTGFWIIPAADASTTNSIYLSGDVVTVESNIVAISEGYQMMSYPFSSDQAIATLSTEGLTGAENYFDADRIAVWEGDHYQYYGLYTDGNWYPCNTAEEWNNALEETDRVISIGEGFWFISKSTTSITETNKYLSNF